MSGQKQIAFREAPNSVELLPRVKRYNVVSAVKQWAESCFYFFKKIILNCVFQNVYYINLFKRSSVLGKKEALVM